VSAPLTFLERSWRSGRQAAGDHLVEAARQNTNRRTIPSLAKDTHRSITPTGRRNLMTLGRWLYSNYDALRAGIRDMAKHASRNIQVDVASMDLEWDKDAEAWLNENEEFADYRGTPYNMRQWRRQLCLSVIRDGAQFTYLTSSTGGMPWIQPVSDHKIGSAMSSEVKFGPWAGLTIIDGVICDPSGRPQAYRYVPDGDAFAPAESAGGKIELNRFGEPLTYTATAKDGAVAYVDISRRAMIPSFLPDYCDQVRGYSLLGASLFDWQDIKERRSLELVAQKLGASVGIIEHNEEGGAMDAAQKMVASVAAGNAASATADYEVKQVGGVDYRYFKTNGGGLDTLKFDRPTANQQAFEHAVKRDTFSGLGWSYYLSDPKGINGGALRMLIDNANATLDEMMALVLVPAQRRVDNYRLSAAITLGIISPPPAGGYKLHYLCGKRMTADAKYDAQVSQMEIDQGTGTRKKYAAQRNTDWERNITQLGLEFETVVKEAKRIQQIAPELTLDSIIPRILASMRPNPRPLGDEGGDGGDDGSFTDEE